MSDSAPSLSPLIHLVDDDAAVREGLSLLIATVGLRVQAWADPQAFLAGFDRGGIGAVLLDVRMPGIGGLAVLEQLQAQGVDQPVILLTGHGTVDMCRSMCARASATRRTSRHASVLRSSRPASARCWA